MNKNYKIAIVIYKFSEGGLERIVSNSTFAFQQMGCEVHLYVLSSQVGYDYAGRLHQYPIDALSGVSKMKAYMRFAKSLKQEDFDFIIDHRCRLNLSMEFFWSKYIYRNQKVFHYIHSADVDSFLFRSERLNRFLYSGSFICVSKALAHLLQKKFPSLDFQVVYNPVGFHKDYPNNKDEYIISLSRMADDNQKQVDVLLECYAKSLLPSKGIRLMIIGNGSQMQAMKELANELGIQDLVEFKGFISDPYQYIADAKYTILSSKYEGLPTVLIESLMLGTPVIAFDCPTGPAEIILNKENGLLIENQNEDEFIKGMNLLAEDHNLYEYLKAHTKESAKIFSIENFISEWKELFKKHKR